MREGIPLWLADPIQQFKNTYCLQSYEYMHFLAQVGISNNLCSVICCEFNQLTQLCQWMETFSDQKVQLVGKNSNEILLVRQCISSGCISVLVDPEDSLLLKMQSIIKCDIEVNGCQTTVV